MSNWLRPGAATSLERLFCHVYGRGKGQAQMIPGWPYSVIAVLEPGRTSWTAAVGHWHQGDLPVLVVFDAGYDVTRLAWLLADLPVELLGRLRSDRVMWQPAPPRRPGTSGRPRKHGRELPLSDLEACPDPQITTRSWGGPGQCAETRQARPGQAAKVEEPPPGTTSRRGKNDEERTHPQGKARTRRLNGKLIACSENVPVSCGCAGCLDLTDLLRHLLIGEGIAEGPADGYSYSE